jgi:aryl-alcohol dehydrogenase-like predicted oxidoreductase
MAWIAQPLDSDRATAAGTASAWRHLSKNRIARIEVTGMNRRSLIASTLGLAAAASLGRLPGAVARVADSTMLTRKIPASGEALPVIGLGTSGTFDVEDDPEALRPLAEVLRLWLEGGGRLLDTAPSYGRAQAVAGTLIEQAAARGRMFLATKVSSRGREAGERQIAEAMRELRTDRLDLVQVHNLLDWQTQLALLRELKAQGKVRYIGVTHYLESAQDDVLDVVQREPLDFVQINLSAASRNAERRLLPTCQDKGVAVLINRAFEDGRLFARVKGRALPDWAADIDCTSWAQVFLKFVVAQPAVTCVLPATSKPKNLADNLLAGHGRLPDAALRERIAAELA